MTSWPPYGYQGPQYEPAGPRTQSQRELAQAQQILDQARQELARAQQFRDEAKRFMSQAIWCDPGDHAFSAKDPDAQQFERRYKDPDSGDTITDVINVCGAHMADSFRGALAPMTADQRRIRALEHDTGIVRE